ncbi:MAG: hypothetical protein E7190_10790 [Erysipelotrichaceae bacterium]|nr:hypothetical protein [Erysipelotrichaceae bacterium]
MKQYSEYDVKCPACGHEYRQSLPAWINVSEHPEQKESVLDGSLFTMRCPACGCEYGLVYPLLYHDSGRQLMIQLIDGTDENPFEKALDQLAEEDEIREHAARRTYTMRAVHLPNDLTEKILIFEENLDDRAVELMKPALMADLMLGDQSMHVVGLYFSPDEAGNAFVVETEDGFVGQIPFDQAMYQRAETEVMPRLDQNMLKESVIDHDWALRILKTDKQVS